MPMRERYASSAAENLFGSSFIMPSAGVRVPFDWGNYKFNLVY